MVVFMLLTGMSHCVYSPGDLIWESHSNVGLEGRAGSLNVVPLELLVTMLCAVLSAFINPEIK